MAMCLCACVPYSVRACVYDNRRVRMCVFVDLCGLPPLMNYDSEKVGEMV